MDLISRQAAIDALDVLCQEHRYRIPGKRETYSPYNEAWQDALNRAEGVIGNLPSAQPEEIALHESCTDCPLYDKDKHRCPRFNKVIPETLRELQSAQPEPCEDAVSRRRLLSDLKELTAAWGKYPVMEEQIKGVEAAIGYVETIPSAQPEQRWIPCSERLPEYGKTVLWCNDKGSIFTTAITYMNGTSWAVGKRHRHCQVVAWMPLPEPYREEGEKHEGSD